MSTTRSAWGASYNILSPLPLLTSHARRHDWGSQLCFQAARQRPDKFTAVVGVAVPYLPTNSPTFSPTSALVPYFPHLAYQVFLGETPDLASAELDADIRRSLRATLRSTVNPPPKAFLTDTKSYLGAWKDVKEASTLEMVVCGD